VVKRDTVYVTGYHTAGDGAFGSHFFKRVDSAGTDNTGTIIVPNGVTTYYYALQYEGVVNVKWFGAVGDGVTDNYNSFSNIPSSIKNIELPKGNYIIGTNTTINATITLVPGAVLNIKDGITVTFTNEIIAGIYQIFNLNTSGLIIPNLSKNNKCYIEWFGAIPNDSNYDTSVNFTQAQQFFNKIELQAADYWINNTIVVDKSHFTIKGKGKHWLKNNQSTRIIQTDGTKDAIYVYGSSAVNTDPSTFVQEVHLSGFDCLHVNLTTPALGNEIGGPAGIRVKYALYTYIENVNCVEGYLGFVLSGTIQSHLKNCFAFRSSAATVNDANSNDKFFGFFLDGNTNIGLAGGNGSTYITDCSARTGGNPTLITSVGLFNIGNFVDTFIFRMETSHCIEGISFDGTGATNVGNVDVHIINPVVDTYSDRGIYIRNTNNAGNISISSPYCAPAGSASSALGAIEVRNSNASVSIINPNLIGGGNTNAVGINIASAQNVTIDGGCVVDFVRPISLTSSNFCSIITSTSNYNVTTSQAALWTSDANSNYFKPTITGASSNVATAGIQLTGNSNNNESNTTNIDTSAINGGVKYANNGSGTGNIQSGVL